jgi:hypothetical protein
MIFLVHTYTIINSPESKNENDGVMRFYNTFLKVINAKI